MKLKTIKTLRYIESEDAPFIGYDSSSILDICMEIRRINNKVFKDINK